MSKGAIGAESAEAEGRTAVGMGGGRWVVRLICGVGGEGFVIEGGGEVDGREAGRGVIVCTAITVVVHAGSGEGGWWIEK